MRDLLNSLNAEPECYSGCTDAVILSWQVLFRTDMQTCLATSKYLRRALLGAVIYTLGAIISWWMVWFDLHDRFVWLESAVNSTGEFLLNIFYGRVYERPIFDSFWLWPCLFSIGFIGCWLLLFTWSYLKRRWSKRVAN